MNKQRKTGKTIKKSNIHILCMVGLIVYLCFALVRQQVVLHDAGKQISQLESAITQAETELSEVQDLDAFSHTDAYIERVAREKLGLVLPDETVFVDVTGR